MFTPKKTLVFILFATMFSFNLKAEAQASNPTYSYNLYFGGLRIASLDMNFNVSSSQYNIKGTARSRGLVSTLQKFRSTGSVRGRFNGTTTNPTRYALQETNKKRTKNTVFTYKSGGPDISFSPSQKVRVPYSQRKGSLDPFSLLASLSNQINKTGSCAGSFKVIDGQTLYRVQSRDKGYKTLSKTRANIFSGQAKMCELSLKPVVGRGLDKTFPRLTFYFGKVSSGGSWVPVRATGRLKGSPLYLNLSGLR